MILSRFYYRLIKSRQVKKSIIIINVLFALFFMYMGITDERIYHGLSISTHSTVYTTEGVILLLICSFYFFELFQKTPFVNLRNEPAFWISTGLLFFMACTLPYSFLVNYIAKYYPHLLFVSYSIFYVFYILLFATIIRAYLGKPMKSKFISN
jgi:hypothetical protein